uniref:Uncharacterized protein n=1 Tax=Rhizophora mucronata TaxID=61149 RepID=A0A2P2PG68_RHIMU
MTKWLNWVFQFLKLLIFNVPWLVFAKFYFAKVN